MVVVQVPKHRVAVKSDWHDPFIRYIKTQYGASEASGHEGAVRQLESLRNGVLCSIGKETTEATVDQLKQYLGMLLSIEIRFPVSPKEISVQSSWIDGISGKKFSRCSLHFEKAAVIYNLGCTFAHVSPHPSLCFSFSLCCSFYYFQKDSSRAFSIEGRGKG